ncbi:hypothetical protein FDUTEX481_00806 [Tolypothrix sp. PCC 7601]|nr:hypothetical protein FDUTEX481_00806 [Tolypothrix sp. PCC 7601]BAY92130.1 hypothetical protein NIES3275_41620 [Microchaete diplosiphon NIES-3275]
MTNFAYVIPIHKKFDTDANAKKYAESHFLHFEFCGKLRAGVPPVEQTLQDEF